MRIALYSRGLKLFVWLCFGFGLCVLLGVALYLLLSSDEAIFHAFSVFFCLTSIIMIVLIIKLNKDGSMNSEITIDMEGIKLTYKKRCFKMKWNDVRLIGLTEPLGKAIVFSDRADHRLLKTYIKFIQLSSSLIVVPNRKGLIEEIEKHWGGKIINEERYIRNNRNFWTS